VHDEIDKRKQQESLLIHQSRLAAMGEMIGAIAHQWRQPLNALSLVMQNIRMQHAMGTLTEQSMARMQDKSGQLVERMSSTIDEFRNLFKPSKNAESFNLAQSMRSAADLLDGVFKNHSIELEIVCDDSIFLYGIPGEFYQVILNLLANAKDALLDSKQAHPYVLLRACRAGRRIHIDVEDNGGGVAPEILNKVFEPYFTTKEEGKGSGIGLYMSKMIVENNMHGRLNVANTAEGACFTLDIPASGAA
jgi:C4-dicarboxylate-specific signal transduction histidine kinase